ncbi:hypothetical protein FNU76_03840 [Chitinimonas arctica]|uniref:Uncharacterized protein n=1 Tax=Chitinimonas arctica TaxID=2594795 RepID=A0A516SBM9_9NEIS|nr:hypothetical protein [Chitinimonas arctica]QDQ25552.1 hypothetical protein FNU76_03840 [Chitinimonas arctica]
MDSDYDQTGIDLDKPGSTASEDDAQDNAIERKREPLDNGGSARELDPIGEDDARGGASVLGGSGQRMFRDMTHLVAANDPGRGGRSV